MRKIYIILIALCFSLQGCGGSKAEEKKMKLDKVIYRFTDSSVPPEYHRSYNIEVSEEAVTAEVLVYGELIATDTVPFSAARLDQLAESAKKVEKTKEYRLNQSGTTFSTLEIYAEGKCIKKVEWEGREGPKKGTLEFTGKVKALMPTLESLLETEYSDHESDSLEVSD